MILGLIGLDCLEAKVRVCAGSRAKGVAVTTGHVALRRVSKPGRILGPVLERPRDRRPTPWIGAAWLLARGLRIERPGEVVPYAGPVLDQDLLLARIRRVVTEDREPEVGDVLDRRLARVDIEHRIDARERCADLIPTGLARAAGVLAIVDVQHRRRRVEQDHHARLLAGTLGLDGCAADLVGDARERLLEHCGCPCVERLRGAARKRELVGRDLGLGITVDRDHVGANVEVVEQRLRSNPGS